MVAPLNRNQEVSKKELKKYKSLALKVSKIVRKHRGLRKAGNSNRAANANYLCHKCGKPGHFIRDCPMHKVEHKDYPSHRGDKCKKRDSIPDNKRRKTAAHYVVKKMLPILDDSSSESGESEHHEDSSMFAVKEDEDGFDAIFAFMEKSDDENPF
ncbi:uncharacterized protein LOC125825116 [Solanum verrucosum]|uniref:uncharacterized protein LOC125825116 n=1 Tax=Solanum verrucosum TaxID=315347 RepID=UPI0020D18B23|nr:uncharacterized protein LOC125825116 [Solanum verrucosum]